MKIHRYLPIFLVSIFLLSACAGQVSAAGQPTRGVFQAFGPEVTAQVALHGAPLGIAKGFGSLWVAAHSDDSVYRLDATTGQIQATITDSMQGPNMVAILDDAVWVSNSDGQGPRSLVRIDPATNKVTAAVATPAGGLFYVVVYQGAPWLISPDTMSLARVDPKTYQLSSIKLPVKSYWDEIYADTRGIWVNDGSNLYLINTTDGSVLQTLPLGGDPGNSYVRAFSGTQFLVMDKVKFWLLDAKSGEVTKVSMDPSITSIPVDEGTGTYGEGAFWAIGWGDASMLLKIDPKSHKVTESIKAGYPSSATGSILPDGDTVWLTLFDMDSLVKIKP